MVRGVEQDLGTGAELVDPEVERQRGADGIGGTDDLRVPHMLGRAEAQPVARVVALDIGLDRLGRPCRRQVSASASASRRLAAPIRVARRPCGSPVAMAEAAS